MKQLGDNEVQSYWTDVCLKPVTGGIHTEYRYIYICIYFPLTAFHPDQPEREQDEDVSTACVFVNALSSVCKTGYGYFYTSIVCMCACLPFGSMYSALVLTGPGDMKFKQPHHCWAARFSSSECIPADPSII